MRTASSEVRFIAVKACQSGVPRQQVADIVGYHLNSISRWVREFERDERLEARPRGHRASIFSDEEIKELIELIKNNADITLEETRAHFAKNCSLNAIHKHIKVLGFVFKKNSEGKRAKARRHCPSQSRVERLSGGR
ncbi:MAG: helix-turn-helix domain-containing protein [Desulfovibrio sp.]|jgi:transposase|nr:helix-turn-helix domain-containing protein [Desulfovibrio sp.]